MAEVKLNPELRFPEFLSFWDKEKLGDFADIYDGTHQTPKYVEFGIPFVSVENINNLYETNKYVTAEAFEKDYKIKPKKDDILMTRITAGVIGATSIVKNNDPLAYYVSLALIRLKNESVGVDFLNHYLATNNFKRELHKRIIHIAFPKKINLGEINHCKFAFPSLPEQKKIATFLTAVDERIQLLQDKKTKLEAYKKGVMQKLFSQEIRFKDDDGNPFPDWEVKKLGNMCAISKGKQLNKVELTDDGLYPCQNGGVAPSGFTDQYNTEANTITISEGGNSCGYVNLMKSKFWCGGHCYALLNLKTYIDLDFLFQSLKYNQNNLMRLRVGSGLPNIQKGDVTNFKIEMPSMNEQIKIASFLKSIDESIEAVSKEIEGTTTFKKGLLQKMFV